jgi:hypothetical protein
MVKPSAVNSEIIHDLETADLVLCMAHHHKNESPAIGSSRDRRAFVRV